jgi:hypothetical protein
MEGFDYSKPLKNKEVKIGLIDTGVFLDWTMSHVRKYVHVLRLMRADHFQSI